MTQATTASCDRLDDASEKAHFEHTILAITWNVGNKEAEDTALPTPEQLLWLVRSVDKHNASVVSMGLQEVHPHHLQSWAERLEQSLHNTRISPWRCASKKHADTYFPVLVFVAGADIAASAYGAPAGAPPGHEAHDPGRESVCRWDVKEDPLMGTEIAQKGCTVADVELGNENKLRLRVINCHLRHAYTGLPTRIQQQRDIEREFVADISPSSSTESSSAQSASPLPALIIQCGDLNYRLIADPQVVKDAGGEEGEILKEPTKKERSGSAGFAESFERMVADCEAGKGAELYFPFRDQLQREMLERKKDSGAASGVYGTFHEMPIAFAPTYKRVASEDPRDPHAVRYDREEPRLPGWCDRVLWCDVHCTPPKCTPGLDVSGVSYEAFEEVTWTDHRPVALALKVRQ